MELKQKRDISDNKGYNNLSKGERITLKELNDHKNQIVTKADKGGAVVVMDLKDWINEAHRLLNNKEYHKKLSKDPTTTNAKFVNGHCEKYRNFT